MKQSLIWDNHVWAAQQTFVGYRQPQSCPKYILFAFFTSTLCFLKLHLQHGLYNLHGFTLASRDYKQAEHARNSCRKEKVSRLSIRNERATVCRQHNGTSFCISNTRASSEQSWLILFLKMDRLKAWQVTDTATSHSLHCPMSSLHTCKWLCISYKHQK